MPDPTFRFILWDDAQRDKCVRSIQMLDTRKRYAVDVTLWTPKRSTAQNRLYWLWVNQIAELYGYTPDELHEYFKQRFLPVVEVEVMREKVMMVQSTTKLTTKEFTDYLAKIELVAGELGMDLKRPDDYSLAMSSGRYS